MKSIKPPCGHSAITGGCKSCKAFLAKWYEKITKVDPNWRDIEAGLDTPDRMYEPVDLATINPEATAYYDSVWAVHHAWVREGRSKRDCLVAELLAAQDKETGTERGISGFLRCHRLRPNSRLTVRLTIQEINTIIFKIAQGPMVVEQAPIALRQVESKPSQEETNGQTASSEASESRAA